MFFVGQHVICTDIAPNPGGGLCPTYRDTKLPVVGGIYTIRRIFCARQFGHDDLAILLDEVHNPVRRYISRTGRNVRCEQFWLGYRFRPVRTTSIEVFRRMLEPVPKRQPVEEEAADLTDEPVRFQMCEPHGFASVGWRISAPPSSPWPASGRQPPACARSQRG